MESVHVGHMIRTKKDVSYFNLLNNFKLGINLSFAYLLSFIGILAFIFLLNELAYRVRFERGRTAKFSKRFALALSKFQTKNLSAVGIFILLVYQFLWITQLFLTNNIKVSYFEGNALTTELIYL